MNKRRRKIIKYFLRSNILYTLWFNFKMLPLQQAIHLPIFIFGKFKCRSTTGYIDIQSVCSTGMIKIGKNDYYPDTNIQQTIWNIRGKLIFRGPVNFLHGTYLLISDNAVLDIGTNGTIFGTGTKIICFDKITISDHVGITWECQLIDTSFHYIELMQEDNRINPLTKPIYIGNNVWIGNRTTVSKGTVIPDNTIVTSNSLVNKDFSDIPSYSILAGCPAKLKGSGFRRIYDNQMEKELDRQFGYVRTHL